MLYMPPLPAIRHAICQRTANPVTFHSLRLGACRRRWGGGTSGAGWFGVENVVCPRLLCPRLLRPIVADEVIQFGVGGENKGMKQMEVVEEGK